MGPSLAIICTWATILVSLAAASVNHALPPLPNKRAHRPWAEVHARNGSVAIIASRALSSGWKPYVANGNDGAACYVDYPDRVLTGWSGDIGGMSINACVDTCKSKGFTYAGVQFGYQCFCGSSLRTTVAAPSSDCSSTCASGSDQCGGSWRLNVYQYSTSSGSSGGGSTTGGWTSSGCVQDAANRALTGYSFTDGGMTVAKCTSACASRGYSLAGIEVGSECYCGNSLSNGQGASLPAGSCNWACQGDGSSGTCGGSWALSLFRSSSSAPAPATTTTTTTPASTPTPATNGDWSYVGCTQDQAQRTLSYEWDDGSMTVGKCLDRCRSQGFSYGGVEFGFQCFCGSGLNGGNRIAEGSCNVACAGGGSGCGGSWAISLWKLSAGTSTPSPNPPSGWNYQYCMIDANARALPGATSSEGGMTVSKCLSFCSSKNFALGGVQNGNECWCDNALRNGLGSKGAEGDCSSSCAGGGTPGKCGGSWRLSLYSTLTGDALAAALRVSAPAATTTTTTPAPPANTQPSNTGGGGGGSYTPNLYIAGSGAQKSVWAHHIVGNTYPYSYGSWVNDINLAKGAGIDGFALNLGTDGWQPSRVADAYNAANNLGFKMFLSFDMTAMGCGDGGSMGLVQMYLNNYLNHPAAARFAGKPIVSTFGGDWCTFGQGNANNGWNAVFGGRRGGIYWMPAYINNPAGLGGMDIDGEVNWGSAWPEAGNDPNLDRDRWFMSVLGSKAYIGTVSPLFYAGFDGKNWLHRGDNFMFGQRWEQILTARDRMDQIELLTWNDYGESTYMGPITGDMPGPARRWATNDFDHTALLSLNAFYAQAFKAGQWPTISQDKAWLMARPHPVWAGAPGAAPDGRGYTQDNVYAQVHLVGPAQVTICAGGQCSTKSGNPGINRFAAPLGPNASVRVDRNGQTTVNLNTNFPWSTNPSGYNFNYAIKSS